MIFGYPSKESTANQIETIMKAMILTIGWPGIILRQDKLMEAEEDWDLVARRSMDENNLHYELVRKRETL